MQLPTTVNPMTKMWTFLFHKNRSSGFFLIFFKDRVPYIAQVSLGPAVSVSCLAL